MKGNQMRNLCKLPRIHKINKHPARRAVNSDLSVNSFVIIFTARKRSLGQGNIFTGVCLSTGGVCIPAGNGQVVCIPACNGVGVSALGCLPRGISAWGRMCLPRGLPGRCLPRGVHHTLCGHTPPHPAQTATEVWNAFLLYKYLDKKFWLNFKKNFSLSNIAILFADRSQKWVLILPRMDLHFAI